MYSTDWVEWRDSPYGVYAHAVLPPLGFNPYAGDEGPQPGDILVAVDNHPIYKAEVVWNIATHARPGTVFIYRLARRTGSGMADFKTHNCYVVAAYRPPLLEANSALRWYANLGVCLLMGVLTLLLMVLWAPLVRSNPRQNGLFFGALALFFLAAAGKAIRYLLLLSDHRFQLEAAGLHGSWVVGLLLAMAAATLPWAIRSWPGWLRGVFSFFGLVAAAGPMAVLWREGPFFREFGWAHSHLWSMALVQVAMFLPLSSNARQGWDAHWRTGWSVLVYAMVAGMAANMLWPIGEPIAWLWLCAWLALGGLLVHGAVVITRFGKAYAMLERVAFYAVLLALVGLTYWAVHTLLAAVASGGPGQTMAELLLMAGLLLAGRWLFTRNRNRWAKVVALPQQRRELALGQFISKIPRYAHSNELLKDVSDEVRRFFNADTFEIWLPNAPGTSAALNQAPVLAQHHQYAALANGLGAKADYWTHSREVSQAELSNISETRLAHRGVHAVFPIRFSNGETGLMLIGRRKYTVFNLTEIELLLRLVQQTQLSLEILNLLEKEKVLLEKTMEANLTALRSQINPHFLFNTLNTISALIHDAPDQAEQAVEKLAYIFRHTLKFSSDNFVTIGEEMKLVRSYLDIEALRFGDRLSVSINLDPRAEKVPIPTLMLQTIVENCVKHGISKITRKAEIRLDVRREAGHTYLSVYDNGPGIDVSRINQSTGLSNTLSRLEKLYSSKELIRFSNLGNGTLVELFIPNNSQPEPE